VNSAVKYSSSHYEEPISSVARRLIIGFRDRGSAPLEESSEGIPVLTICTACYIIKQNTLHSPPHTVCVFHAILKINTNYLLKQNEQNELRNRESVCFL
jgi:hypothetical protein